jgi:hypothetical protein
MIIVVHRRERHGPPAPQERTRLDRVVSAFFDIRLRLLMAVLLLSVAMAADTAARDYGQYGNVDPQTKEWVKSLTDKSGQGCCATADGFPADYDWDTAGNHYRVRIEDVWYDVPPEAVVDGPNKLGHATVWYWWDWGLDGKKTHHIRCFLPGPGG